MQIYHENRLRTEELRGIFALGLMAILARAMHSRLLATNQGSPRLEQRQNRVRSTEDSEDCIEALGSATASKEDLIPIGKWTCTILPYRLY